MLLKGYGHDDKGKWLNFPTDNVDLHTIQKLLKTYHEGNFRRINHSFYIGADPRFYDPTFAQNYILDISYLKEIDNLEAYFLSATKVELQYLENLNPGCLEYLSLSFKDKYVGQFKKSNKIDLSFVSRFKELKSLSLTPDSVSPITIESTIFPKLISLSLIYYNDISKIDFTCFPQLRSLGVGSKKDAVENYNFGQLKKLRSLGIYGFPQSESLDFLQELEALEELHIEGFSSVTAFPDLSKLIKLKWIFMDCRGIRDFSNLATAPNIQKISISPRISKDFDVELFRPITESESLKEFNYTYDYQSRAEEKKMEAMFGDRYYPYTYQIFLHEDGEHEILGREANPNS